MAKKPMKGKMAAFEKMDEAMDKKKGIKEKSKKDMMLDAKAGFPYPKGTKVAKAATGGMMGNSGGAQRGLARAAAMSGRTMPTLPAQAKAFKKGGKV